MLMSLINPNQMRHHGLVVSDDPTDHDLFFGITGENFTIPFDIAGTTIFFSSRAPTRWELQNCRIIKMTMDSPWNPSEVYIRSVEIANDSPEITAMREICSVRNIPRCLNDKTCECCKSDMSAYNESTMISRMVTAVRVASAHRDSNISFVGSKDRHS